MAEWLEGDVAPHEWEEKTILLERGEEVVKRCVCGEEVVKRCVCGEDVVKRCVCGDVVRVMRNAGGGGGHELYVSDFKMKIEFKMLGENGKVYDECEGENVVSGGKK